MLFAFHFLLNVEKSKLIRRANSIKELDINEGITEKSVKIISTEGEQMGVFSLEEALSMADEQNLDLVKVAVANGVAICKFMDYSKYRFDQQKKEKEMRKNQKVIEMKEVAFTISTQENDLDVKRKQAVKFLQGGHKIKLVCKMINRQKHYTAVGIEKVTAIAQELSEFGVIEKPAQIMASRRRSETLAVIFMAPIKKVK